MSYTSLPTRGPADLQAAITDVRAPAVNELSADSIEAIKTRIIEIGTSLGTDAGTTAGSIREILGAAKAVGDWTHRRSGSSNVLVRHNFGAAGAPTTGDDTADGYAVGSLWFDSATGLYVCFDATGAAAVWRQFVFTFRTLTAGAGLTGGGDLSLNRSFAADFGTGSSKVQEATTAALATTGAALKATTITATAPLTIDGGASADLSANRTIAVSAATTSAPGVSELATSAECFTGTDTVRTVTPKALADTLQPAGRTVSGTTDTISAADIGNVILYSQAGGVTVDLVTLAAALISGRALVLTLQGTNAATVITVDPNATGTITIDGSTSNFVASTGKARVSLISLDGINWFSGTP